MATNAAPPRAQDLACSREYLSSRALDNTPPWSLAGWRGYARIVDVYDGDTVKAILEYSPDATAIFNVRVLGIDAPEIKSLDAADRERAKCARNYVVDWCCTASRGCAGSTPCCSCRRGHRCADDTTEATTTAASDAYDSRKHIQAALQSHVCVAVLDVRGLDKYGRLLAHVRCAPDALASYASQEDADLAAALLRRNLAIKYQPSE